MRRTLIWLMVAAIGWFGGVAGWIAVGPSLTGAESGDTAIVLGAAVNDDVPSPVFAARIDHAIELYRQGRVQHLLLTGGRSPEDRLSEAKAAAAYAREHLLLTGGRSPEDRLSEAKAAAAYARDRGVPIGAIMFENRSSTTRQNLENARRMLGVAGSHKVVIVSDPLHMRRAMAMAADVGLDAQPSPTPSSRYRSLATQLPFLAREVWFMHSHWLLGM